MNTPLLLSAPVRVIRDAARATKRKAGLMLERVTAGTLSTLLGLPGMVVTEYALEQQGEREVLHIFCEHAHEVAICPHCGQVTDTVHERKERCIRHLDIWGKATFVHFAGRRFDCAGCGKPFTDFCLGWKASVGRARPTNCMCTSSASILTRRRWLIGKPCILKQ